MKNGKVHRLVAAVWKSSKVILMIIPLLQWLASNGFTSWRVDDLWRENYKCQNWWSGRHCCAMSNGFWENAWWYRTKSKKVSPPSFSIKPYLLLARVHGNIKFLWICRYSLRSTYKWPMNPFRIFPIQCDTESVDSLYTLHKRNPFEVSDAERQ